MYSVWVVDKESYFLSLSPLTFSHSLYPSTLFITILHFFLDFTLLRPIFTQFDIAWINMVWYTFHAKKGYQYFLTLNYNTTRYQAIQINSEQYRTVLLGSKQFSSCWIKPQYHISFLPVWHGTASMGWYERPWKGFYFIHYFLTLIFLLSSLGSILFSSHHQTKKSEDWTLSTCEERLWACAQWFNIKQHQIDI